MLVYFAGPLFSQAERRFNEELAGKLESLGFQVFLPQRDGEEKGESSLSRKQRRKEMFNLDLAKIKQADIFLFVLDGRVPDEGACVELGIAYSLKDLKKRKLIVGLQTDVRAAFLRSRLNPMLRCCFDFIAKSEEELFRYLKNKLN